MFGDLKKYVFYYKFKEVNDGVEYQIKKITNCSKFKDAMRSELSNLKLLNYYESKINTQEFLKHISGIQDTNNNLIVHDFSNNKHQIPSLIKNTLYNNISLNTIFNILLVKDSNTDEDFKNSIILTIHSNIKEIKLDLSQTQTVIVDLKNLLNPFT
jgi:hypothetical protein